VNYLVHLYLSGPDPEMQLGGIMGDFVKGPIPDGYPVNLARGLNLHRRIDSLAQHSRHARRSRQRLQPKFGHGRGIIIDIFYDHFLASAWSGYSPVPLADYAAKIYRVLQDNHDQLPASLQRITPHMIAHNWLLSYQHRDVVGRALQRIAQRLSRPLPLADGVEDLAAHEASLRQDFANFMVEAADFVKQQFDITVGRVT
jgi:acyl carrier protein phosphodiesterase